MGITASNDTVATVAVFAGIALAVVADQFGVLGDALTRIAAFISGIAIPAGFVYFMPPFSTPLAQLTLGETLGFLVWVLLVIPAVFLSIACFYVTFVYPPAPPDR